MNRAIVDDLGPIRSIGCASRGGTSSSAARAGGAVLAPALGRAPRASPAPMTIQRGAPAGLRDPPAAPSRPASEAHAVHVRPPEGFFAADVNGTLTPQTSDIAIDPGETARQDFGPHQICAALGLLDDDTLEIDGRIVTPDRLELAGNLTIPAGTHVVLRDLLFTGTLRLADETARLTLERCAIHRLIVPRPSDEAAAVAHNCLFNSIGGGLGFVQLVHCTVLEETEVEILHASDCIFAGPIIDLDCSGDQSCIRYSRVPSLVTLGGCGADKSPSNTDLDPNFIRLWFEEGDGSVKRPALFGEPGAGVLDLVTLPTSSTGRE